MSERMNEVLNEININLKEIKEELEKLNQNIE